MTLEAQIVSFRYPRRNGSLLEHVDLVLNTGERLGLSAPSGRGKTTLCKLLAGWERPDQGEILLNGVPLAQNWGFCPVQLLWQHPEEGVDPLLKLRTGELQRICLARTLRPELRFLLCDEASAMLDLVTQARLWRFLLEQTEQRELGLLVISHDTRLLERLCTRMISLS